MTDTAEIWKNLPFEIREEPGHKNAVLDIIRAIVAGTLAPRAPDELFEAVQEGIERADLNDIDKEAYLRRVLHRKPRTYPPPTFH